MYGKCPDCGSGELSGDIDRDGYCVETCENCCWTSADYDRENTDPACPHPADERKIAEIRPGYWLHANGAFDAVGVCRVCSAVLGPVPMVVN